MIDMAFAKKRVDDRKLWLLALEPGECNGKENKSIVKEKYRQR